MGRMTGCTSCRSDLRHRGTGSTGHRCAMVTLFLEASGSVEFKVQTSQRIFERLDLSGATALFASWSPEHVHILPGDASAKRK